MIKDHKLYKDDSLKLEDPYAYRRLVGRLLYLGYTRPNIAYATQQLSQYVHDPKHHHWMNALCVLRYLKGRPSLGLYFSTDNNMKLEAFCDLD